MRSSPRSETRAPLLDLERDLPTTSADVEALRRLRAPGALPADWLDRLASPALFAPPSPRRETAAGRRPFTL